MTVRITMLRVLACGALLAMACGSRAGSDVDASTVDPDANDAGIDAITDAGGGGLSQGAYIKASNTGSLDHFGWSIALSADGSTLAVGGYNEDGGSPGVGGNQADNSAMSAGAVYIYVRAGETWTQQAYVKASNPRIGAMFGNSVALSADGSILAVGAPYETSGAVGIGGDQTNTSASNAGAVYVFTRAGSGDGAVWAQQEYIKASNTGANDIFGYSVALSADGATLAVGAYSEASGVAGNQADNSANGAGAVYVFTRAGAAWSQQAYVKASNPGANDSFGFSVGLSANGSTLAVGAYHEDSAATGIDGNQASEAASDAGAAYVFARTGSTWTQEAYVKTTNTTSAQRLGYHLALSGDGATLAVAAQGESTSAAAVYVFARNTTWSQQAHLKASNTAPNDWFGLSVGISADGSTLLVGAPQEDSAATGVGGDPSNNAAADAGAGYLFRRAGTAWSQSTYLKASNTEAVDHFGYFVGMSADASTIAIAAPGEDSAATGIGGNQADNSANLAGAVYVFR